LIEPQQVRHCALPQSVLDVRAETPASGPTKAVTGELPEAHSEQTNSAPRDHIGSVMSEPVNDMSDDKRQPSGESDGHKSESERQHRRDRMRSGQGEYPAQ
jgi:hypothetical protein